MDGFWELCKKAAIERKFIAGWNKDGEFFDGNGFFSKTSRAKEVAKSYSHILTKLENKKAKLAAKYKKNMRKVRYV